MILGKSPNLGIVEFQLCRTMLNLFRSPVPLRHELRLSHLYATMEASLTRFLRILPQKNHPKYFLKILMILKLLTTAFMRLKKMQIISFLLSLTVTKMTRMICDKITKNGAANFF